MSERSAALSRAEAPGAQKKIAFCFLLGYSDVTQPSLWLHFFGRSEADENRPGPFDALFNVYVHQDPGAERASLLRRPLWRDALLPEASRVRTHYRNGTSLELARIALFRYAWLDDASNFKFVLVSESCIPMRSLREMHSFLVRDARPRVHELPDHLLNPPPSARPPDKSRGKRWVPSLEPLIPMERRAAMMLQARQWVVASRAEVENFPSAAEIETLFAPMPRAEEHVFLNVLVHRMQYRRYTDIDVGCVTWQRMKAKPREAYRVPLTCRNTSIRGFELEREKELLHVRMAGDTYGCLFARKFAASCDLSCFARSGFTRFRC